MDNALTYIGIAAAAVLIFWWVRWGQFPKRNTQRLVTTVWAAFGPFNTAQDAEDTFRTVARVVLGLKLSQKDEGWVEGHIQNFHEWEKDGRFEQAENMMRKGLLLTAGGPAFDEAFKNVQAEYGKQVQEIAESLNKDLLEEGGHKLETVTQPDGRIEVFYNKIWSDEKIDQKQKEDNEAILSSIGNNLLNDNSDEAKELVEFLKKVYRHNADKEIQSAQDLGTAWFACLSVTNEEPESEVARTFQVLNDAWSPPKADE